MKRRKLGLTQLSLLEPTFRWSEVPRAEWEVFLPQHHEAYISQEHWERNMAKISSNAPRSPGNAAKRSPGKGASLLADCCVVVVAAAVCT